MRHAAPMRHPGMGAMYLQGNRNKRSIALDLKKASGRAVLLRLAAAADVFVHNVRPAAMARLKLGASDLLAATHGSSTPACTASARLGPMLDGPPMTT